MIQFVYSLKIGGHSKGPVVSFLGAENSAAYPSRCRAPVIDGSNHLRTVGAKWHTDTGTALEADGTIASPWSGLHFLVLSVARVCLSVGYGSDGQLSLLRTLPGKTPFIWKEKGHPLGGDFINNRRKDS